MISEIIFIISLFLAIMFSFINIMRSLAYQEVRAINIIIMTIGIVGIILKLMGWY